MIDTPERLVKILLKTYKLDPSTMKADMPLDELGIDSLGVGLMLFDIEDEFKLKFRRDPGPLKTLGDVARYIDEVLAEQRSPPSLRTVSLPTV